MTNIQRANVAEQHTSRGRSRFPSRFVLSLHAVLICQFLLAQQSPSQRVANPPRLIKDDALQRRVAWIKLLDTLIESADGNRRQSKVSFQERYTKTVSDWNTMHTDANKLKQDTATFEVLPFDVSASPADNSYAVRRAKTEMLLAYLATALDLNNDVANLDVLRYLTDQVSHFSTLYRLQLYLERQPKDTLSSFILQNYKVVEERYKRKVDEEFNYYSVHDAGAKRRVFIGAEINHGNDVLDLIPMYNYGKPLNREEKTNRKYFFGNNHDRDMTGAFRADIYTDYLQMRGLLMVSTPLKRLWNFILKGNPRYQLDDDPYYSYQSIFVTGMGITPMLRDTAIFRNSNSYDSLDRPYASFIGFGISKHRLHRKGNYRTTLELSVGRVGSGPPSGIQATLHRDAVESSLNPNGWGAQIAGGDSIQQREGVPPGRIGFQYYQKHDVIFYSKNRQFPADRKSRNLGTNFYGTAQLNFGCVLTSLDFGLGWTNHPFRSQNASGALQNYVNRTRTGLPRVLLFANVYYRTVVHNSLLEGFGYTKRMDDGDPYTPKSVHTIRPEYVNRGLFIGNFGLTLNTGKISFYLKYEFTQEEIERSVDGVIKYPHYFSNTFKYKDETFYFARRPSGLNFWGVGGFIFTL